MSLSFTNVRKDKAARIYLERRTKVLEWIKDCFVKHDEPLTPQYTQTDDLIEMVADELARAHMELEVDDESSGQPLSEFLSESLPNDIESKPTIQFHMSSLNSYDSNLLSAVDSTHQRTIVINTPKLGSSTSSPININTTITTTPVTR
eukprot:gene13064-15365_t